MDVVCVSLPHFVRSLIVPCSGWHCICGCLGQGEAILLLAVCVCVCVCVCLEQLVLCVIEGGDAAGAVCV